MERDIAQHLRRFVVPEGNVLDVDVAFDIDIDGIRAVLDLHRFVDDLEHLGDGGCCLHDLTRQRREKLKRRIQHAGIARKLRHFAVRHRSA